MLLSTQFTVCSLPAQTHTGYKDHQCADPVNKNTGKSLVFKYSFFFFIHRGPFRAAGGSAFDLPIVYCANQTTTKGTDWRTSHFAVHQTQTVSLYPEPLTGRLSPKEEKLRIHRILDKYTRSGALFHEEYRCVCVCVTT